LRKEEIAQWIVLWVHPSEQPGDDTPFGVNETGLCKETDRTATITDRRYAKSVSLIYWRNMPIKLKIADRISVRVGYVELAKAVRKVEFRQLQIIVRAPGLLGVVPGYC
jgi:hypothetical protein